MVSYSNLLSSSRPNLVPCSSWLRIFGSSGKAHCGGGGSVVGPSLTENNTTCFNRGLPTVCENEDMHFEIVSTYHIIL